MILLLVQDLVQIPLQQCEHVNLSEFVKSSTDSMTLPNPLHKTIIFQYDDMLGPCNTSLFPYFFFIVAPYCYFCAHVVPILLLLCPIEAHYCYCCH